MGGAFFGSVLRRTLAAVPFVCVASFATSQVAEGLIFGHRIGEPIEGYAQGDLRQELSGWPFVYAVPENAAEQFDRLRLVVTPITGKIVAVVGVAEFATPHEATEFGQEVQTALWATYGPNQYIYNHDSCGDADTWRCAHLSPDIYLYASRQGDFALRLHAYTTESVTPSIHLSLEPMEGTERFRALEGLMLREGEFMAEAERQRIAKEAANGVLLGVE